MDRVLRRIAAAALTTAIAFGIATATDQLATPVAVAGPAYVIADDDGWDGGDGWYGGDDGWHGDDGWNVGGSRGGNDASWDDDDWDDD
jgi:hypothetical protein